MDEELFLTWFEEIFVVGTSHVRPTLLIIDGHGSDITYSVIKRAVEENIRIILLPPHTTKSTHQTLDVGLFRSLKANVSKVTDGVKMLRVTADYQNINKTNFTAIFKESFERSMSLPTIKNGFRKTGIYLEAIDKTRLIPIKSSPSSTPLIPTSTLPGTAKVESKPTENLEKSEHDFNITSSEKTPSGTSTQNILIKMNIISQYLADVFYLPSSE